MRINKLKSLIDKRNFSYLSKIFLFILFIIFIIGGGFLIAENALLIILLLIGTTLIFIFLLNSQTGIIFVVLTLVIGQLTRISLPSGGSIVLNDLLIPLVFLIWLLVKLKRKKLIIYQAPLNLPLVIFIIIALFSLLLNRAHLPLYDLLQSSAYFWRFLTYSLVFWMVLDSTFLNRKDWNKFYNLSIFIGLSFAFLGFLQFIFIPSFEFMAKYGWDPHINRLLSTFFDPNFAGGFLVLVLALILGRLFFSNNKAEKGIMFYFAIMLVVAIILTFSRSTYLAFLVTILVFGLIKSWRTILIGGLAILIIFFTVPRVQERVLGAVSLDITAKMRLESYKQAYEIIKDYPLTGVGYNTLRFVRPKYKQVEDIHQHAAGGFDSSFLTIWATTGLFGLLTYLWFYLIILKHSFLKIFNKNLLWQQKGLSIGILAGLSGLIVHSQFVNSLLYPHIMVYLWFILGLLFSSLKGDKVNNNK